MEFNKQRYEGLAGFIDYCYIKNDEYPNGLFIFMGSLVYPQFRNKGFFTQMVKHLLSSFPDGTIVQAPVSNKNILRLFQRLGFVKVERIEYWENVSNGVMMQATLNKILLDLI